MYIKGGREGANKKKRNLYIEQFKIIKGNLREKTPQSPQNCSSLCHQLFLQKPRVVHLLR